MLFGHFQKKKKNFPIPIIDEKDAEETTTILGDLENINGELNAELRKLLAESYKTGGQRKLLSQRKIVSPIYWKVSPIYWWYERKKLKKWYKIDDYPGAGRLKEHRTRVSPEWGKL